MFGLAVQIHRYLAPVKQQVRHHLNRLTQRVGGVAGALHKCEQLDDPRFGLRALHFELIGESLARRRHVGEAELPALIEFSLHREFRLFDLHAQI
jgi:hypothetical protein